MLANEIPFVLKLKADVGRWWPLLC